MNVIAVAEHLRDKVLFIVYKRSLFEMHRPCDSCLLIKTSLMSPSHRPENLRARSKTVTSEWDPYIEKEEADDAIDK